MTTTTTERLASSRKRRSTGTTVEVYDRRGADEGSPWRIVCVEHDARADRATAKEARKAARAPETWCAKCRAAARRKAAATARAAESAA